MSLNDVLDDAPTAQTDCGPSCTPSTCGPAPEKPIIVPADDTRFAEQLAALAKALGHPARVQIMRILLRRNACVCGDIVDELPLAQSTVSQHLKQLKAAGLVRGEVDGPRVCYCVEPTALAQIQALLGAL